MKIPYSRQSIDASDRDAVDRVLQSDFLTTGPEVERFEKEIAEYCGVKFALSVSSATAGLLLAYRAAGLEKEESVWTSPVTFISTANASLLTGGKVDFVDIDPHAWNLNPSALEAKLKKESAPRIVAPVHLGGVPADLEAISKLSKKHGFKIVEDAAHALSSEDGDRIGACTHSDIAVFSFHPVKPMTTGEGGVVVTNDPDAYDRMVILRNNGMTRDRRWLANKDPAPWHYEQIDLSENYRMTDLQAALGRSQLKRLDSMREKRQHIADRYFEKLNPEFFQFQKMPETLRNSWHLFIVRLQNSKRTQREVHEGMREAGIGVNLHYIPVYHQPYYRRNGFKDFSLPEAERYFSEAITLPLFPDLKEKDQDFVIQTLHTLVGASQ